MSWLKLTEIFHFSDNFLQRVVNWLSCVSILAPLGTNTSWELENKATFCKSCLRFFFQSNSRGGTGEDPGKRSLSISPICQTQPPLLESSRTMQSLRFQKALSTPKKMWITKSDRDSLCDRLLFDPRERWVSKLLEVCGDVPPHTSLCS